MATKLVIGNKYRMKKQYCKSKPNRICKYESNQIGDNVYINKKMKQFYDGKPRKLVSMNSLVDGVTLLSFEGIKDGPWRYPVHCFEKVGNLKLLVNKITEVQNE